MDENIIYARVVSKNPDIKNRLCEIITTVSGFVAMEDGDKRKTDLLIFEMDQDPDHYFSIIHDLKEKGQVDEVFLTCATCEADVLLRAIKTGVGEFFSQPLDAEEIRKSLLRYKEEWVAHHQERPVKAGRLFYFMGSKGGVGATTLVANLAGNISSADKDKSVAVIDMNMLYGGIPVLFDLKCQQHLGEVVNNIDRLDETFLMSCLTGHESGVQVLSAPTRLNGGYMPTPDILEQLMGMMQNLFDYILIDGGKHIDDNCIRVMQLSELVLMAIRLDLPALTNARNLLNFLFETSIAHREKVKVVVNRYSKKGGISLRDAESSLPGPITWAIPDDVKTAHSAINKGQLISSVAPRALINKNLKTLAAMMISENGIVRPKRMKLV